MNLYDKVSAIAKDNNLSIAALEAKSGVANGTISGWRTGRPYAETLKKIAVTLNTTMDELMQGVDSSA